MKVRFTGHVVPGIPRDHTRHLDVGSTPTRARAHARSLVRATDECVW